MELTATPTAPPSRSDQERIAEAFFLVLLFVVAFTANSTVCVALLQSARRLRNPSNVLLVSVFAASLFVTLLCVPFSLVAVLVDRWPFGDAWCQVSGFLFNTLTCASNFSVAAVAISRYYLIVKPLALKVNLKRARTMVGFAWFSAATVALPPLFGWGAYKYSHATATCAVSWRFGGSALAYSVYLVAVSFILPLVVVVYTYRAVYKKAKRQSKKTAYNTLRGLGNGFLPQDKKPRTLRGRIAGCLERNSSQSTDTNHSSPATSANSFSAGGVIGTGTLPKIDDNVRKDIITRTLSRQNSVYEHTVKWKEPFRPQKWGRFGEYKTEVISGAVLVQIFGAVLA